jgi:outer membrane murein-binding lipoprotein Lpp
MAGPSATDHEALLVRVAQLEQDVGALQYLHTAVRTLRIDTDDLRGDVGRLQGHQGAAQELHQQVGQMVAEQREAIRRLQADLADLEHEVDEVDQRNEVRELQADVERLEQEKADV